MAKKDVFDESFEKMIESDNFDINKVFEKGVEDVVPADEGGDDDENKTAQESAKDLEGAVASDLDVNKALGSELSPDEDDKGDDGEGEDKKGAEDKKKKDESVEKKATKEEGPSQKETDDSTSSSSETPFTVVFARDLDERGLISSYDEEKFLKDIEEVGEADALRNLIKSEIDTNVDAIKSQYDEGYQTYLELVQGGTDAETAADLTGLQRDLSQISEDDLTADSDEAADLRRSVITEHLRITTSLSEDRIAKMVDKIFDLGDDVSEAKESYSELKSFVSDAIEDERETAKQRELEMQEESRRQMKLLRDTVDSLNEVIPGQRINKQTKDKIFKDIVEPVKDKNGNVTNRIWVKRSEDPFTFDAKLAYLVETGFFDDSKTWRKLVSSKETHEASALEKHLRNTRKNAGTVNSTMSSSGGDLDDLVSSMKSIIK